MSSVSPAEAIQASGGRDHVLFALTDTFSQLSAEQAQAAKDIASAVGVADPRTRAIFNASIAGTGVNARVAHDPVLLEEKLTRFEGVVSDPSEVVLLTPFSARRVGARVLSGEVQYYVGDEKDKPVMIRTSNVPNLDLASSAVFEGMFTGKEVTDSDRLHHPQQLLVGHEAVSAYLEVLNSRIVIPPKKDDDPVIIDKLSLGDAAEIKGLLETEGIDVATMSPELIGTLDQYAEEGRERVVRLLRQNFVQIIRDEPNKYSIDWDRKTEEAILFSRTLVIARALDATDVILPTIEKIDEFYAGRAQGDTEPYLCFPKGMTNTEKWRQLELRDRLGRALS